MSAPICGHDREVLRWALDISAQTDAGRTVLVMAGHRQCKTAKATAHESVHDPAKLVAIIAELLRERGTSELSEFDFAPRTEVRVRVQDNGEIVCVAWRFKDRHKIGADRLTMPAARGFALALLDAPADANVEQMIAEVSR